MPKAASPKSKPRAKRRAKTLSAGLSPSECRLAGEVVAELAAKIQAAGGEVLTAYKDPLGGHPVAFAALPTGKIEPTPFQRDLSEAHEKRLSVAIEKLGRYLDPIVTVVSGDGFWTPNGLHRLQAMKRLGAKTITALVLPEPDLQYKILALNIEKAHSLREKSLEVIRMYRAMAAGTEASEDSFALEFEEPAFATLGVCYEKNGRFSGGAYHPILKRVDGWFEKPLAQALKEREARAAKVQRLEELVAGHVKTLQARGFKSPYLRAFIVARVNPLRFMKTVPPFDEALDDLIKRAERFDPGKVRQEDVSASAGPASE